MRPEERELLIGRYLDDALDDEGRVALNRALSEDPAAAAAFVAQARLHAALFRTSGAEPAADGSDTPLRVAALQDESATRLRQVRRRSSRPRARRPRRSPAPVLALVAAAAVLVFAIVIALSAGTGDEPRDHTLRSARVTLVEGEARIDGHAVAVGGTVADGARIDSAAGRLGIALADGSGLLLGPDAQLRIVRLEPATVLRHERGELHVVAAQRTADAPLRVELPLATATVVGTRFHVRASPQRNELRVEEGRVRFVGGGVDRIVGAGEVAVVEAEAAAPAQEPAVPPPEAAPPSALAFVGFTLLDLELARPVPGFDPIPDGAVIDRAALDLHAYTIIARLDGPAAFVRFHIDGRHAGTERNPPYPLGGNRPEAAGAESGFVPLRLEPGEHVVAAEAEGPGGDSVRAELRFTLR